MITRRMDNGGFEIVRGQPQVLITGNGRTLVAGTMQLLTDGNDTFEEPMASVAIKGMGWNGQIVQNPDTTLPGGIDPFVWIESSDIPQSALDVCLHVTLSSQGAQITRGVNLQTNWDGGAGPAGHSYSLRPTLRISNCFQVAFTDTTTGGSPARENEGNLTALNGANGIVIDVDMDNSQGFAVTLDDAIASAKRVLGM